MPDYKERWQNAYDDAIEEGLTHEQAEEAANYALASDIAERTEAQRRANQYNDAPYLA